MYQIYLINLFSLSAYFEDFRQIEHNVNVNFACIYSYCNLIFSNS